MKKLLLGFWLTFGIYFIIASIGGGAPICAAMAMICGFMVARNWADIVQPVAKGKVAVVSHADN